MLTHHQARLAAQHGTPVFVYDKDSLLEQAMKIRQAFSWNDESLVRFAMKALPTRRIIQLFAGYGIRIDASSLWEVKRAHKAGVQFDDILLTTQQFPVADTDPDAIMLRRFIERGLRINACSLHQLELYGKIAPGHTVYLRVNAGVGDGHSKRTTVGGPFSSFGVWHEQLDEAKAIAAKNGNTIVGLHSHIGSGAQTGPWIEVASIALRIIEQLPDATTLSLGGGFKIARMPGEKEVDIFAVSDAVSELFFDFMKRTGRKLGIEVEPGTFLVAHAGNIVCRVTDVITVAGHNFIKVDAGMTEILRPSLYGAQHPIAFFPYHEGELSGPEAEYYVSGHCCESGDTLTPEDGNGEMLKPRTGPLPKIGDWCCIGEAGAYCSAMAAKHYNSFPEAAEILIERINGENKFSVIRNRGSLEDIIANET